MSLFGFGDIDFNIDLGRNNPLKALEGTQFGTSTFRYPADVGSTDKGHYMAFFIREQARTQFSGSGGSIDDSAINELVTVANGGVSETAGAYDIDNNPYLNFANDVKEKINNAVDSVNAAVGSLSGSNNGARNGSGTSAILNKNLANLSNPTNNSFIKTTYLTKDVIALYMPDTLEFAQSQSYDTLSLGGEFAGQALAAGKTALQEYLNTGATASAASRLKAAGAKILEATETGVTRNIINRIAGGLGQSSTGQVGAYLATGKLVNPLLELLYKSPDFRTFQFDFMFYPRDEKEALEVQKIIRRFEFHQAPELANESIGFLIPPSEFEIRFYYGGSQNPNLPTIGTCVLTDTRVNYAPNGWSAYEIPGKNSPSLGGTGMPVAIQLTLIFKEVSYLTKANFLEY